MNKIISQCEEIRAKMPETQRFIDSKNKQLEAMKSELAKYDKPHLRQKIKELEVSLSQNDIESTTLTNKLESLHTNLKKKNMDRGELEAKLQENQRKLKENTNIKDQIIKAKGIAEKMMKDSRDKAGALN